MPAIIVEVYDALRSAGVSEDKAKAAAEVMFRHAPATRVSAINDTIARMEDRVIGIQKDVRFIKWTTCAILALVVIKTVARFAA